MSVSSIGGSSSPLLQALKEFRSGVFAAPPTGPEPGPPSTVQQDGADPAAQGGNAISGASAKVIADLQSLLLGLQSTGGTPASNATGSTAAGTAANTSTASATTADASSDTSSTGLVSELTSLFTDLGKLVGKGGHHHPHGPPPDAPADGTSATTTTTDTASQDGNGASAPGATAKHGSVFDEIARVLSAYAAPEAATQGATTAITA